MAAVTTVFDREAGRVLATLIRLLGDFDLAEEARQDACMAAIEQWPSVGIPANPSAWLIQVGRHKAIDRIRREHRLRGKLDGLLSEGWIEFDEGSEDQSFGDDRLRLIFTCCHPALNSEAQIALTLREICGLNTAAVARAFLVSEETMAQRLVRAKKKIRDAGIAYETPEPAQLDARIADVLAVIYLVFSEGYAATTGVAVISAELCREAIRLGRLLNALLPQQAAVEALLALMLLHDGRRDARTSPGGDIVLLDAQDRSLWNTAQIDEGLQLIEQSLHRGGRPSAYAVQAAIAALHAQARDQASTDWPQILGLYEVLLRLHPTPVIELNHAVAVSMVDGPARALNLLDSLAAGSKSSHDHLLHAARAHLLQQLGRGEEARAAYTQALGSAQLEPERRLLQQRLSELGD